MSSKTLDRTTLLGLANNVSVHAFLPAAKALYEHLHRQQEPRKCGRCGKSRSVSEAFIEEIKNQAYNYLQNNPSAVLQLKRTLGVQEIQIKVRRPEKKCTVRMKF